MGEYYSYDYFLYDLQGKRIHITNGIRKVLNDNSGEIYKLITEAFEYQYNHTKYSNLVSQSRFFDILNIWFKNEEKRKLKSQNKSGEIYKANVFVYDGFN